MIWTYISRAQMRQVPICEKLLICAGFSAGFQAICPNQNDVRNGRQINLEMFPNYVKGFVSEKHNFNKNSSALTDFWILGCFGKPCSNNAKPNFLTLWGRCFGGFWDLEKTFHGLLKYFLSLFTFDILFFQNEFLQ